MKQACRKDAQMYTNHSEINSPTRFDMSLLTFIYRRLMSGGDEEKLHSSQETEEWEENEQKTEEGEKADISEEKEQQTCSPMARWTTRRICLSWPPPRASSSNIDRRTSPLSRTFMSSFQGRMHFSPSCIWSWRGWRLEICLSKHQGDVMIMILGCVFEAMFKGCLSWDDAD